MEADPDADDLSNFYEYAFGGNPVVTSAPEGGKLTISVSDTTILSYHRRSNVNDVDYVVETSTDLSIWNVADAVIQSVNVDSAGSGVEEVHIHLQTGIFHRQVREAPQRPVKALAHVGF